MIKAVLFDLDGTLTNRQRMLYNFNWDLLRYFFNRVDPNSFEYEVIIQDRMLYDMFGLGDNDLGSKLFCEKYNIPYEEYVEYSGIFANKFPEYTVLKEETIPVLKELQKRGYKLGIISNGEKQWQRRKMEVCDLWPYFNDCFVVSEELNEQGLSYKKPMKEIYEYAANLLGVKCEECIYVGDNFSGDIRGAFNSNMYPIWMWSDEEWGCKMDLARIFNLNEVFKYLGVRDDD